MKKKVSRKWIWIILFIIIILIFGYLIWIGTPRKSTEGEFTIGLDEGAKVIYEFYLSTGVYKKQEYLVYTKNVDTISKSVELNAISLDTGFSCFSSNESTIRLGEAFTCLITEEGGAKFKLVNITNREGVFKTWFQIGEPHPEGPFQPKEIIITKTYIACGCGCCDGIEPQEKCLYHSKGDDIQKIIGEDRLASQSPICPQVGCSLPIRYIYCD